MFYYLIITRSRFIPPSPPLEGGKHWIALWKARETVDRVLSPLAPLRKGGNSRSRFGKHGKQSIEFYPP